MLKFSLDNLDLRYEPFPIGCARPILDQATYQALVNEFPPTEMFVSLPKVGNKFVLSEKFNEKQYHRYLRSQPLWRDLHRWVKSEDFIDHVMTNLLRHGIDLGYTKQTSKGRRLLGLLTGRSGHGARKLGTDRLRARFEFSMLPARGGHVLPHTDTPSKIITIVVSILRPGEWNPALGGGTDVNRPKDPRLIFNLLNRKAAFSEMEVLHTFPFEPNQAVIFVKTFNSWHSVRPMTGNGAEVMRRTLTINIETG